MNVIPAFLCLNSSVRIFQRRQKASLWGKGLSEYFLAFLFIEQFCKNITKALKGVIMW